MIKLVSETIDRSDINSLISWISQEPIPILTKNKLTENLEKKWASKIGTKYSVFVNSGSSSILLTLAAIKYSGYLTNKKIVIPALSWATDLSTPILLDYDPILCDCNLNDLSCDLNHLEQIFIKESPSVLLLVSPLGLVPNMEDIMFLCKKYNVLLLEDVCESMGSKYHGKYLGNFGLASFFSTYFGHHLSTIEGGFINTNDEKLYELLIMMRSHGWDRDLSDVRKTELRKKYNINQFDALYTFYVPGMNLRSTDLQAYIGLRAIDKLDEYSIIRNNNFHHYNSLINNNQLSINIRKSDFISNFAYPILNSNRNKIVKALIENDIEVRPLIAGNMGKQPMWINYKKKIYVDDLNNVNKLHESAFYVPNHHQLTFNQIEIICKIINQIGD